MAVRYCYQLVSLTKNYIIIVFGVIVIGWLLVLQFCSWNDEMESCSIEVFVVFCFIYYVEYNSKKQKGNTF